MDVNSEVHNKLSDKELASITLHINSIAVAITSLTTTAAVAAATTTSSNATTWYCYFYWTPA